MRLKARVSTTEKPCVSVITTLITRSIIAHVMRGVNPHRGGFSGDSFTPKTRKIAQFAIEKVSKNLGGRKI